MFKRRNEDSQWLPISDLMSGLMILFLFVAISFILNTKKVSQDYQNNQEKIYKALKDEFSVNLSSWQAKIDKDNLTFIFTDPEVLFNTGESNLRHRFKEILNDFFPRYIRVIDKYKEYISEIRIEGHTSSEWLKASSEDFAYFENMKLSQDRTRSVLFYVYNLDKVSSFRSWIKSNFSAVGLSSSKLILNKDNTENKNASKRVTFRIITDSESELKKLLDLK